MTTATAAPNAVELRAQQSPRIVRESARTWRASRELPTRVVQQWCTDPDATACDFRAIASGIVLPSGGVLLAGAQGPIREFDADARFVRELGRRGRGPGEYGFVVEPRVLADGRLVWFDNTQMRLASLQADGTPGEVTPIVPPPTIASIHHVGGQLVVLDVPATPTRGDTVDAVIRTVPAKGWPRELLRVRTPSLTLPGDNVMLPTPLFAARAIDAIGARFDAAFTNATTYDVTVAPVRGARWRLLVDMTPRRVTRAERDSAVTQLVARWRAANAASLPPAIRQQVDRAASSWPAITAIAVLRDGTIAITPTSPRGAARVRVDLFAADGRRLGHVLLPRDAVVLDGSAAWLLVRSLDADDVPIVTHYAIASPSRDR